MPRLVVHLVRLMFAYLVAGAVSIVYLLWPHFDPHAEVPFSGFPGFLVWSPIAPYLLWGEFLENASRGIISWLVFAVTFVVALWLSFLPRLRSQQGSA
jgi:hypothetical protein